MTRDGGFTAMVAEGSQEEKTGERPSTNKFFAMLSADGMLSTFSPTSTLRSRDELIAAEMKTMRCRYPTREEAERTIDAFLGKQGHTP